MNWSLLEKKSWHELETAFSWVADMRGVPQDPVYHAEGDVATHTRMVMDALETLDEFHALDGQLQEVMRAAALLHDVEKRSTTVTEEDGRISSRGHAKKGEYTARYILFREVPTPFFLREKICALVRHHGLPLWVLEKADPVKALLRTSLRVEMPLLAMLAKADVLGRITRDQHELLDRVALFEEFCREHECWDTPRSFASDLARFVYFQKDDSPLAYVPYDDLKGEVIMLSGLPGMGKDTYIHTHYADLPVVSLDDIRRKHKAKADDATATGRAVQEAKESAKMFLRKGQPFVFNATNVTRQLRSQWISLFATYHARVTLVYVEVPYTQWLHQNKDRQYPVPPGVLERLLGKLDVPAPDEAHTVAYIV